MNLSIARRLIVGIATLLTLTSSVTAAAQSIGADRAVLGETVCQPDGVVARVSLTNDYPGTLADIDLRIEDQVSSADAVGYLQAVTLEVLLPGRTSLAQTDGQATLLLYGDDGNLDVRSVDVRLNAVDCAPPATAPETTTVAETVTSTMVPEEAVPTTAETTTTTEVSVTTTTSAAVTTTPTTAPASVEIGEATVQERAVADGHALATTGKTSMPMGLIGLGLVVLGLAMFILRRPTR